MVEHSVSDRNIKRYKRAVKQLQKVLDDCKAEDPDVYFWNHGWSLLMIKGQYLDAEPEEQADNIICSPILLIESGDP